MREVSKIKESLLAAAHRSWFRRVGRSGGCVRAAPKPRSCRVELLEDRTLLSVAALDELPEPVWAPRVDAAWFAEVSPGTKGVVPAAGFVGAQADAPPTAGTKTRATPAAAAADQWLVQLTPQAARQAGSVAGTANLLGTNPFQTEVVRGLGLKGMALLKTEPGADPGAVAAWLGSHPQVEYYEPNGVLGTELLPNDASFSNLWGLHNTGQTGGRPDADIDAPGAWGITTGSRNVVVAVIDSGVDYTHPDLAANMWTNPGEIAGNRIDDDGNGFVDDVHGYDFVHGDGNPMDDDGHGTHVAGTIAGVGNNGRGVTGVNWTGSVMTLKFLDADGYGTTGDAIAAVNYATMMRSSYGINVRVTSNSWGGGEYSRALRDAIRASGQAGILFVAAAGNDGTNNDVRPHYPSDYQQPNVIAVAATNHNDRLASFSNFGSTSVDLAAPGVNIYSTVPRGRYESYSGTSMAGPHVAGAAALVWSKSPNATVAQVRSVLLDGTDPIASLRTRLVSGGRLNVLNSLRRLSLDVKSSDPAAGSVISTAPVDFTVHFTHAYDPASVDADDLTVNGTAAGDVTFVDGNTARFHFAVSPVLVEGPQVMRIREGAILRAGDGNPIGAWQAGFRYDVLPLAVTGTAPTEGEVLVAGPNRIVLDFNEPIEEDSVGRDDLTVSTGQVLAAVVLDADSVAYAVTGLARDGRVEYVLREGAISDVHGGPNTAYAGQFTIDDPLIERFESSHVPRDLSDHETATSRLTINESFTIADLDVQLDITHEYDADLDIFFPAPDGTRITLLTDAGGSGNDFNGTILDDEAARRIESGSAPFIGRYRPEGSLSTFDGFDAKGIWTLVIRDDGWLDLGTLNGWALIAKPALPIPPRIVGHTPFGRQFGPMDTAELAFDRPMVRDSFSMAEDVLSFAGPQGDIPLSGHRWLDAQTVELTFAPQSAPGEYTLVVGPQILDTRGLALDQDGDLVPGEVPDDRYAAVFSLGASLRTIGEAGSITVAQPDAGYWHTVTLLRDYINPVVVMSPASYNGVDPTTVRVKDVGSNSFRFQLGEWDYRDGVHTAETVGYIVIEAGRHELGDGTIIEAGTVGAVNHNWRARSFEQTFQGQPVVLTQTASYVGPAAVVTRQRNVTIAGFDLRLQEEEGADGRHARETVHYIALERGTGIMGDNRYEFGTTPNAVTHAKYRVDFRQEFDSAPVFLAAMQTFDGSDPAGLRFRDLNASRVWVHAQEERSRDAEVTHTTEVVGYALFEQGRIEVMTGHEPVLPGGLALGQSLTQFGDFRHPLLLAAGTPIVADWLLGASPDDEPAVDRKDRLTASVNQFGRALRFAHVDENLARDTPSRGIRRLPTPGFGELLGDTGLLDGLLRNHKLKPSLLDQAFGSLHFS